MNYVEAFNSLGYDVPNPRQDWSAEKSNGICITLWKVQVDWTPLPPSFNLWALHEPGKTDWEHLPGHAKRCRHIERAVSEFEGKVDVIIVSGEPTEGYGTADPWLPLERHDHSWFVTKFDSETGFFSATVAKLK